MLAQRRGARWTNTTDGITPHTKERTRCAIPNDIDAKLEQIIYAQATIIQRLNDSDRRLGDLERLTESVNTLALTTRDLVNSQNSLSGCVATLRTDVDDLKSKPGRRWDGLMATVTTVAASAFITYLLTR